MKRMLIASLALLLIGGGFASAQPSPQSSPQPGAPMVSSGADGQTVDEGTLLERRLAASGRTHGSYRAAASHGSSRHHGRAGHGRASHGRHHGHGRSAHGRKGHGRARHAATRHGKGHAGHHASAVHHRHRRH